VKEKKKVNLIEHKHNSRKPKVKEVYIESMFLESAKIYKVIKYIIIHKNFKY
jgi:hypothetical protein